MARFGPDVDIRRPPASFDAVVDWLEGWSYRLVLLEEYPLTDILSAVDVVEEAVRQHRREADRMLRRAARGSHETSQTARVLESDHEWFETSLEQFRWFLAVVEREDHGGHRQALGQYGRVLAEALRRHRRDERALEESSLPV